MVGREYTREPAMRFDHERLDVYRTSLGFVVASSRLIEALPSGYGYLADQLRRAALSVTLNIAEGAGEYAPAEKARFYRMAKRSATECAAILDVVKELAIADLTATEEGLDQLFKIVAMLVKLCKAHDK
jgi:four helix bundle protein